MSVILYGREKFDQIYATMRAMRCAEDREDFAWLFGYPDGWKDAKVMERVIAMSEKRLLDDKGRPYFDLSFYALSKDGRYAGGCAYEGGDFAVCDEKGARVEKAVYLFKNSERPKPR